MDTAQLDRIAAPPIKAVATPIFWAPHQDSAERIVPLFLLVPNDSTYGMAASVFRAIRHDRLTALMGPQRAQSANGILDHVANFVSTMALQGLSPEEISPPFQGFSFGPSKVVRGYSKKQLLDTALRSVCAFGNPDGLFDYDIQDNRNSTVTTREFIKATRASYSKGDKDRNERFDVTFREPGSRIDITLDYAYKSAIVQVASVPITERQALGLKREAESKLLELRLTYGILRQNATYKPQLLLNNFALQHARSEEAWLAAKNFVKRIEYMSKRSGAVLQQVESPSEAAQYLESLV